MPTMYIAVKCTLCGAYMDSPPKNEEIFYCRCGVTLNVSQVKLSAWGQARQQERNQRAGFSKDILPSGPPDLSKGGSKVKKKRKKKPERHVRVRESPDYFT